MRRLPCLGRIPRSSLMRFSLMWLSLSLLLIAPTACVDPPQEEPTDNSTDSGGDSGAGIDVNFGADASETGAEAGGADGVSDDFVWLTFEVDDSANQTFADAEIKWTGSFSWDQATNTVVYATSWLPTDGPYPVLYDDGPISAGGHEKEGATKGDHFFSTQVKFHADEATVIEYGALNEFDNWMWVGANGTLTVAKGSTGTLDATGMKLGAHGDTDIRLVIDTNALHEKFSTWSTAANKFFVKGTMNMWTPVQLLDDGKKGDAVAEDGVLTYVHGNNLGKHDGLLTEGDEVQFIFVATMGDQFPEDGAEYKAPTEAYADGVSASTATGPGDAWVAAEIVKAKDSKGKFLNTAIVVPAKRVGPGCAPACGDGQICQGGVCVDDVKPCASACADWQTCEKGACVDKPCDPACAGWQTCEEGACVDKPCDPACDAGWECVQGACFDPAACVPACESGQACVDKACVDLLALDKVEPLHGPIVGGTKIAVWGAGFKAGIAVRLDGVEATDVVVQADGKRIDCATPPHAPGLVGVEVDNGGDDKVSKADLFTYDKPPPPTARLIDPLAIAAFVGEPIGGAKALVKVATISQTPGATEGLKVEIGYGPIGSNPLLPADAGDWTWAAATFEEENLAKGEETWTGDFGVLAKGTYAFTLRASYGGDVAYADTDGSDASGFDPTKIGSLTLKLKSLDPTLTGIEPMWVATSGGTVVLLGDNLAAADKVEFTGLIFGNPKTFVAAKIVDAPGKGLSVTTSQMFPLLYDVHLAPGGFAPLKLDQILYAVPYGKVKVDGDIGQVADWDKFAAASQNQLPSDWGVGKNELKVLWMQFDADNLYIGVNAITEELNTVIVYVDTDYGTGTGVAHPADIVDATGDLDLAIGTLAKSGDPKLGFEFAFATIGMASFATGNPAESIAAGWRDLAKPDDLAWLGAPVLANKAKQGIEASIPLKALYPAGLPATGSTLAVVVLLGSKDGSTLSNQVLPSQDGLPAGSQFVSAQKLQVFLSAP